MQYLLENIVNYVEESRILRSVDDEVKLPVAAARLLTFLIAHNHCQVSRDEILNKVWGQYGLVQSDNNLNRNISILRKSLHQFGLKDVIETIPKQGFKLHCQLKIVCVNNSPSIKASVKKISHSRFFKKYSCAILLTTTFFIIAFFLYFDKETEMYKYKVIEKCDVYIDKYLVSGNHVDAFFDTYLGREIVASCKITPKLIYFDDNKLSLNNKLYATHIALCEKEPMVNGHECENFVNINTI